MITKISLFATSWPLPGQVTAVPELQAGSRKYPERKRFLLTIRDAEQGRYWIPMGFLLYFRALFHGKMGGSPIFCLWR
jgi:hypothetical protein